MVFSLPAFRVALLLVALVAGLARGAETPADRWDLTDLYPSAQAWDDDVPKLEAGLAAFVECRGHLGDDAATLRRCLDLQAEMTKRLYRLFAYATQTFDQDTSVAANLERTQRIRVLATRFNEARSFVEPELIAIGRPRIDALVAADPGLRPHVHALDDALRKAPHTLDPAGESLIAAFGLTADTPDSTYTILTNSELPWRRITLADGKKVLIDQSGYARIRAGANRTDRKNAMDAMFGALKAFERTLGVTLYGQLKERTVAAKVRKYPDSLALALDDDDLPVAVYDQLIAQTNASLPTLHRYFRLRARMLGVPQMRYYDIYPPLVKSNLRFPLAEAKKLVSEAMAPLGGDYGADLARGLGARWMDAYPRPHKDPGGYMNGNAYDVHPFVLINYQDDYESLTTLAHEFGHAMHSVQSNRGQPFVTAGYSTFIAEIASTLNEALLLDYMLAHARNDDERLLFLGSALENLRATYYRQAMFAEFERNVHARVDRGESLSGEAFTRTYGEMLRRYHGDAVRIDDLYAVEWAYIPHFYRNFYVYQYATSLAASSLFAERILANAPGARERYLELLRAGSSDYPYELVKRAGVDLADPAPYRAVATRMNGIMDRIEAILTRRP